MAVSTIRRGSTPLVTVTLASGKTLRITPGSGLMTYGLLIGVSGARTSTSGVWWISGYAPSYQIVKTISDASDVSVTTSAQTYLIKNNHASDNIQVSVAVLLEINGELSYSVF